MKCLMPMFITRDVIVTSVVYLLELPPVLQQLPGLVPHRLHQLEELLPPLVLGGGNLQDGQSSREIQDWFCDF